MYLLSVLVNVGLQVLVLFSVTQLYLCLQACPEVDSFRCGGSSPDHRKCITANQVCNQKPDCADKSDESKVACQNKYMLQSPCPSNENYFRCSHNFLCIPRSSVCNGVSDCGDNSDEIDCAYTEMKDCDKLCGDSQKCVRRAQICDGKYDCPYGDDEWWCNSDCVANEFRCGDSRQCVSEYAICDGYTDCRNNADEMNCTTAELHIKKGEHHNFNATCSSSKECLPCTNTSRSNTTTTCLCPRGYQFHEAISQCLDVNECETGLSNCSQICVNTFGAYECRCNENYRLRGDRLDISTECVLLEGVQVPTIILFTTPFEIMYFKLHQNIIGTVKLGPRLMGPSHHFYAIDYVWNKRITIFWSDIQQGQIMSGELLNLDSNIDKVKILYSKKNSYITQLVYDSVASNLYWFDEEDNSLSVLNPQSRQYTVLLRGLHILSLAWHGGRARLYWLDSAGRGAPRLITVAANGSGLRVLLQGRSQPAALCVDPTLDRLFWTEGEGGAVLLSRSADPRVSAVSVVARLIGGRGSVTGSTIAGARFFYAEMAHRHRLMSAVLDFGEEIQTDVRSHGAHLAITLRSLKPQTIEKQRKNLCLSSRCSNLCLANSQTNQYTCHCAPGYQLDEDEVSCTFQGAKGYARHHHPYGSHVGLLKLGSETHSPVVYRRYQAATVVFAVLILLIMCGFLGYFLVRRYRQRQLRHRVLTEFGYQPEFDDAAETCFEENEAQETEDSDAFPDVMSDQKTDKQPVM